MEKPNLNTASCSFTENEKSYDVTFHTNKGFASLASAGLESNEKVQQAYLALLPYESKILEWISSSPENGKKYMENPIMSIENSNVEIPQEIIEKVKEASESLLQTFNK